MIHYSCVPTSRYSSIDYCPFAPGRHSQIPLIRYSAIPLFRDLSWRVVLLGKDGPWALGKRTIQTVKLARNGRGGRSVASCSTG